MLFKSIRWRLSLTYAAIALLVALSLGAVLLFAVRVYYQGLEGAYLAQNATAISRIIAGYLEGPQQNPAEELSIVQTLSFLTRTRVQLLNPQGQVVADSGSPTPTQVSLASRQLFVQQINSNDQAAPILILGTTTKHTVSVPSNKSAYPESNSNPSGSGNTPSAPANQSVSPESNSNPSGTGTNTLSMRITVNNTPFGLGINSNGAGQDSTPSTMVLRLPVVGSSGNLLGSVVLSDGPSYGREVLLSVVRGWVVASGVAVLLAILAGWWFSRRISAPVAALTGVTRRMAGGDLAARAAENQPDEFGSLGRSFNAMAEQVEGTILALRRFVADAAHEMRTPLTALQTNLELASNTSLSEEERNYLQAAQAQIDRLNRLTRDLLDLSRLEAMLNHEPHVPVDVSALLRSISEFYAAQAEQKEVEFHLNLSDERLEVLGNESHLERAIGNLLDNAVKFTPDGGAVTVSGGMKDGWVRVVVADTGIGIPDEDLDGLFGRFHRGSNTGAYPGSGLGLAIVKAIAQAHGGQASVENLHPGARFTLELPVSPADQA